MESKLAILEERIRDQDKARDTVKRLMDAKPLPLDFYVLAKIDTEYTGSADKEKAKKELLKFAVELDHFERVPDDVYRFEVSQERLIRTIRENEAIEWVLEKIIEQKQAQPFIAWSHPQETKTPEIAGQPQEHLTTGEVKEKTVEEIKDTLKIHLKPKWLTDVRSYISLASGIEHCKVLAYFLKDRDDSLTYGWVLEEKDVRGKKPLKALASLIDYADKRRNKGLDAFKKNITPAIVATGMDVDTFKTKFLGDNAQTTS